VDGGDGETGSGVEMAGHMTRALGRYRLSAEGDWQGGGHTGVRASFSMPRREDGTGPSFSVSSGYGTVAPVSGSRAYLPDLRRTELTDDPEVRLDASVSLGAFASGSTPWREELADIFGELSYAGRSSGGVRIGVRFGGRFGLGAALDYPVWGSGDGESVVSFGWEARF